MPASFRGISTNSANAALSISVTPHASTVATDGMLLTAQTSTGQTLTAPAGWLAVPGSPVTAGSELGYAWKKVAAAADLSTAVVVTSSASAKIAASIVSIGGTDTTDPIEAIAALGATAAVTAHPVAVVTTSVNDCLILHVLQRKDTTTLSTVLTAPTGATARASVLGAGTSQQVLGVAGANTLVVAGTYGTGLTYATDGSASPNALVWTVAFKSAPAALPAFTYIVKNGVLVPTTQSVLKNGVLT